VNMFSFKEMTHSCLSGERNCESSYVVKSEIWRTGQVVKGK
jgi:hypothetical protein